MSSIDRSNSLKQSFFQVLGEIPPSDILEWMIEYLDGRADLLVMSNEKKKAEFNRQIVVCLFETWKKIGAIEELQEAK